MDTEASETQLERQKYRVRRNIKTNPGFKEQVHETGTENPKAGLRWQVYKMASAESKLMYV